MLIYIITILRRKALKLFIIGDTHGHLDKVRKIYPHHKGVDMIIHTGDMQRDVYELEAEFNIPVISVPGNCDGSHSANDFAIAETEYGNILVTHGHMQNVDYYYDRLLYLCEEKNCVAAVFGHTHVPVYEEYDGIYLLNPGSLTRPRDGSSGSYGIITTTESTFAGSIIYYKSSLFEKDKVKGGYIKDLLNYSDRF